uniref:Uncharacterized protein AlNc14C111G6416 n=1 Tax=Albugo laibachii Nc14 TaxID=890382 RepID=F0WIL6_9STRA|nr:hypothetical protein PITG_00508 [Albugo laibachii Nc14]|eukprot:CCA21100.1 hypothetical protein PITG_00508 [Albugo laibachii Nc14]
MNGNIISKRATIWVLHDVYKSWRYLSSLKSHEKASMQARDSATIRHHLRVWIHSMRQKIARRKLLQARDSRLLSVVWNSLKLYTADATNNDDLRRKSRRFRYFSLLFNGFTAFKHNKEILDQCVCRFQFKNRIKLERSVFLAWKSFALHRRRLFEIKETIQSCNEKALLKRVWCSGFVKHHMEVQLYNGKFDGAIEHYEHNLLRKTLTAWSKRCQAQRTYMEALTHLARNHELQKLIEKRNKCFSSWKEHTLHQVCTRHIATYIRGRYEHRLVHRSLGAWTSYIVALRRKAAMYQRAEKHQKRTLLLRYFTIWECKRECRISSRNQLRSSLLHWKISLQRKTFHTWKSHVSMKMEERARYHGALEFRHEYFIRQGLRLWFLAATGLQEQRLHDLEMVQAAHSMQIWRKVASIARHWRNRTMRARVHMSGTSIVPIMHFAISQESSSRKHFNRKKPLQLPENQFIGTVIEYSELNKFPRARPRPRKPYDLFLKLEEHTFEEKEEVNFSNIPLKAEPEHKLFQNDEIRQEALISKCPDRSNWTKTPCIDELASRLEYWMSRKRNLIEMKRHVQAMTTQINCNFFAMSNFERKTGFLNLREALEKRITDEAKVLQGARQEIQGLAKAIPILRAEM